MTRRHWLFLILILATAAAMIRLGFWQLARLDQRRTSNDLIRANLQRPPLDLNQLPSELDPADEFRPVRAAGTFDYEQTFTLISRSHEGQPGVHLVTPLLLSGSDRTVLVNRGWIPYPEQGLNERIRYQVKGAVEIEGFARFPEPPGGLILVLASPDPESRAFRTLDIQAMSKLLPYNVLPFYLQQRGKVAQAGPQPEPAGAPELGEGPHLGYAVQWFSFAAIALVGGGFWLRRNQSSG